MATRRFNLRLLAGLVVASLLGIAIGETIDRLTAPEIERALGDCGVVQELNQHRKRSIPPTSGLTQQIFEKLFPYGPAVNALLATLYISGPPNFLLALCPPNVNPSSLSVMVAFAVGGLLGDTIFHLLPEIFLGEASPEEARFVLVDGNKNLLLGAAIIVGFLAFMLMDKSLRIATGGEAHDHKHEAEPSKSKSKTESKALSTGVDKGTANGSIRSRRGPSEAPKDLDIHADMKALRLPNEQLRSLWDMPEPSRANKWLSEVLVEDSECGITQIAIWKAYEAAFKPNREVQLLEATMLIHNASKAFDNASAQIIEGPEKKFVIRGVRPAAAQNDSAESAIRSITDAVTRSAKPGDPTAEPEKSVRLSAYLNLIADFTHNITDGLAISSSFYASSTLGATTTVAVFFHEIPHEVGDFALLIQSGFSKRKAMGAQFVTAVGAFLGTFIGIAVQELGKNDSASDSNLPSSYQNKGLLSTGLGWGDMLLPFTAGTFLYVSTVTVVPELLETGSKKSEEIWKSAKQLLAIVVGAGFMLAISWT